MSSRHIYCKRVAPTIRLDSQPRKIECPASQITYSDLQDLFWKRLNTTEAKDEYQIFIGEDEVGNDDIIPQGVGSEQNNPIRFVKDQNSDSNNNDIQFHIQPNLMSAAQKKSQTLRQFVVQITAHNQEFDLIEHGPGPNQSQRVRRRFESICECGTIVSKRFIATHAHGLFEFLEIGREFDVINSNSEEVKCKVVKVSNEKDCTILTPVDHEVTFSDVQVTGAYPAQLIISLGRSAVLQQNCFDSVEICNISTNITDHRSHYKMSRVTAPGDSGGGVFDFFSGRLVGIMVASENYGQHIGQFAARGSIVPIFSISILCGEDLFLKP